MVPPATARKAAFAAPFHVTIRRFVSSNQGSSPRNAGLIWFASTARGMPQRRDFGAWRRENAGGIGLDLHLQQVAAPARLDRRLVDDVVAGAQDLPGERRARPRLPLVGDAGQDRRETVLDFERRRREHVRSARVHRRVPEVVNGDGSLVARGQLRVVRRGEVRPVQRSGRRIASVAVWNVPLICRRRAFPRRRTRSPRTGRAATMRRPWWGRCRSVSCRTTPARRPSAPGRRSRAQ